MAVKQQKQEKLPTIRPAPEIKAPGPPQWTKGICPNCGYPSADVDPEGILWCPACGYSKKGCYT